VDVWSKIKGQVVLCLVKAIRKTWRSCCGAVKQ